MMILGKTKRLYVCFKSCLSLVMKRSLLFLIILIDRFKRVTLCLPQVVPGAAGSSLVTHRLSDSLHQSVWHTWKDTRILMSLEGYKLLIIMEILRMVSHLFTHLSKTQYQISSIQRFRSDFGFIGTNWTFSKILWHSDWLLAFWKPKNISHILKIYILPAEV